jgi:ketosteroid isomerase-like protein
VSDTAEVVRRWLAAFAGPEVDAAAVSHVVVDGETAAVRARWTGLTANGTKLRSHSALFFTLRNGLVWRVESYDAFPASEEPERTAST